MRAWPWRNINTTFLSAYNYRSYIKSEQVKKEKRNFEGCKAQETKGLLYG
jgi:hypothetical protein